MENALSICTLVHLMTSIYTLINVKCEIFLLVPLFLLSEKNETMRDLVQLETCMSYGRMSFRSFDGFNYMLKGSCGYKMMHHSANVAHQNYLIVLMRLKDCDDEKTCKKVSDAGDRKFLVN